MSYIIRENDCGYKPRLVCVNGELVCGGIETPLMDWRSGTVMESVAMSARHFEVWLQKRSILITGSVDDICVVTPDDPHISGNSITASGGFIFADMSGAIDQGRFAQGFHLSLGGSTYSESKATYGSGALPPSVFNARASAHGIPVMYSGVVLSQDRLRDLGFVIEKMKKTNLYITLMTFGWGYVDIKLEAVE